MFRCSLQTGEEQASRPRGSCPRGIPGPSDSAGLQTSDNLAPSCGSAEAWGRGQKHLAWPGGPLRGTPAVRTHAPPPAISHRRSSRLDLENPSWRLPGPELRQNHVNSVSPIRCQAGGCPGTLASRSMRVAACSRLIPSLLSTRPRGREQL